jgi:sugar lactone lactonase YvrE
MRFVSLPRILSTALSSPPSLVLALALAFAPIACKPSASTPAEGPKGEAAAGKTATIGAAAGETAAGTAAGAGTATLFATGFSTPESVIHDAVDDVYIVSNINGSPFGTDARGFLSRVSPEGKVQTLRWVDGALDGVDLDAPKGMALVGDVLYVADVRVVRKFDRKSGKALGAVPVEGAGFLNDLAAAGDGTVFITDTGIGEGFVASGTDAVHALSPTGALKTLAKGPELGQPNGILADGDDAIVATWKTGELKRITKTGSVSLLAKLRKAQIDGLVKAKDGAWLASSWEGSCVYRIEPDGRSTESVGGLASPADLGYDAKRGRVLIPLFEANTIQMADR